MIEAHGSSFPQPKLEKKRDILRGISTQELFALDSNSPLDADAHEFVRHMPPPPQPERFKLSRARRSAAELEHMHQGKSPQTHENTDGYRKVLARWPADAQAQLYERVIHGEEIPQPSGFTPAAFSEWKKFVSHDWLNGMSPLERARLHQRAELSHALRAQHTAIEKELQQLGEQLAKHNTPIDRMKRVVSRDSEKSAQLKLFQKNYQEGLDERAAFRVLDTIVQENDFEDMQLRRAGQKHGNENAALNVVRTVFDIRGFDENLNHNLHSRLVLQVGGAEKTSRGSAAHVISGITNGAVTELQRRALPGGGRTDVPASLDELLIRATRQDAHGDRRVQLQTYLLELQAAMSVMLADALADGLTVKESLQSEPLHAYVKSYEQTRARVEAGEESEALRINEMLDTELQTAQRDLHARSYSSQERRPLSRRGSQWIRALLEGSGLGGEIHRGHIPTAHIESRELAHHSDSTLAYTVALGESPLSVVQHFVRTMFSHESAAQQGRMAQRFLTEGIVHDSDGYILQHFMREGRFTGSLFASDSVHAIPDDNVPFGFKLEIKRGAGTQSDYYFENDRHGKPEWCYVKTATDAVEVWSFDVQGRSHLAGMYDGHKFTSHEENDWDYRATDGTRQTITEFQQGIYFTQKGTVLSVPRNSRSFNEISMNSLGSTLSFKPKVMVRRGDKNVEMDISTGPYLIAPNKTLYVIDRTFGMMPVGTIE